MSHNELLETLPLVEEEVKEILMHRDAHFGGQFSVMRDYYTTEGKGVHFSVEEVERLENLVDEDLAPLLLSGSDMERVGKARATYRQLRELCEVENPKNPHPRLLADLILSEDG